MDKIFTPILPMSYPIYPFKTPNYDHLSITSSSSIVKTFSIRGHLCKKNLVNGSSELYQKNTLK